MPAARKLDHVRGPELRAVVLGVLLAPGLAACMPMHGYGSARTLDPGRHQYQVVLDMQASATSVEDTTPRGLPVPVPRFVLRRGLTDGLEIGLMAAPVGGGVDLKARILDAERVALAVAPGVLATLLVEGGSVGLARLPLLAEVDVASWLSLRPTASVAWAQRLDDGEHALLAGGSLGFALRTSESITFEPAVSILVDPDTTYRYYGAGVALEIGGPP